MIRFTERRTGAKACSLRVLLTSDEDVCRVEEVEGDCSVVYSALQFSCCFVPIRHSAGCSTSQSAEFTFLVKISHLEGSASLLALMLHVALR